MMQTSACHFYILSRVTSEGKIVCWAMSHLLDNLRQVTLDLFSKLDLSQMEIFFFFFFHARKSRIKSLLLVPPEILVTST